MRRFSIAVLFLVILFTFLSSSGARAATLSWSAPTTYTDNTAIAPADQARITYTAYYGPTSTGPWTTGTTVSTLSATVPEPAPLQTQWYTADCTLDGQTSAKAPAVSKTAPAKVPKAPTGLSVN